jgi:hypothetical protein
LRVVSSAFTHSTQFGLTTYRFLIIYEDLDDYEKSLMNYQSFETHLLSSELNLLKKSSSSTPGGGDIT